MTLWRPERDHDPGGHVFGQTKPIAVAPLRPQPSHCRRQTGKRRRPRAERNGRRRTGTTASRRCRRRIRHNGQAWRQAANAAPNASVVAPVLRFVAPVRRRPSPPACRAPGAAQRGPPVGAWNEGRAIDAHATPCAKFGPAHPARHWNSKNASRRHPPRSSAAIRRADNAAPVGVS